MADQGKTGLPPYPKLIFFDTNIVHNLSTFGELIYDHFLSDDMERKISKLSQRLSDDVFALEDFMEIGQRVGWTIALSANTRDELAATPQASKRVRLLDWGKELTFYFQENFDGLYEDSGEPSFRKMVHFTYTQRIELAALLNDLPQESDRQLMIDAKEYGCDIFLTMDYKTIWRHRACVEPLGIRVVRPVELMEHISPWAGLLR